MEQPMSILDYNPYHKASLQHLAKLRQTTTSPVLVIHQRPVGAQLLFQPLADINPDMVLHRQWATALAPQAK
jgi:hypothetical protein